MSERNATNNDVNNNNIDLIDMRHIYMGDFNCLPPQIENSIKIFLSSTTKGNKFLINILINTNLRLF